MHSAATQRGLPPPPVAAARLPPPPPIVAPPPYRPPGPQPVSAKPFLIAGLLRYSWDLLWSSRRPFAVWAAASFLPTKRKKATPIPSVSIPGMNQRDVDDAFREARLCQEAAERLSEMLSRFDINRQLIQLNQARRQPDAEALEAYRLAEQTIQRQILDSESALLLHAKQLQTYSPEVQAAAFDRLDQQVSSGRESAVSNSASPRCFAGKCQTSRRMRCAWTPPFAMRSKSCNRHLSFANLRCTPRKESVQFLTRRRPLLHELSSTPGQLRTLRHHPALHRVRQYQR